MKSRSWSVWLFAGLGTIFVFLLALPVGALIWKTISMGFNQRVFSMDALAALRLSLLTSTLSLCVTVLAGTPLAYTLARRTFQGQAWVELLIDLPIVLPPSVAGLGLLIAFGRQGIFGETLSALGVQLPFTTAAVVIAQTFVSAPLYIRAARIGFADVDAQLEECALVEGATHWQLFRHVMLPLAGHALVSGAILCWARALGEFGATILFAGNLSGRTQTMPLAIYVGFEQGLGMALALSTILIGVSIVLLLALRRFETRQQTNRRTF